MQISLLYCIHLESYVLSQHGKDKILSSWTCNQDYCKNLSEIIVRKVQKMSNIKGAFIFPHPPIIVGEVGKGHESDAQTTVDAVKEAARRIGRHKPETIIIITPHGNMLSDAVTISGDEHLYGSFANFGAPDVKIEQANDLELVNEILNESEKKDIMAIALDSEIRKSYRFPNELDHGALVPLYFVNQEYKDYKLVHINYSMLPHHEHYEFGRAIRQAIENLKCNVVVICSGDLSHRLTKDAPAGYSPKGKEFDQTYVEIIKQGDVHRLLSMDCELAEGAGECGLRATVILYGILEDCSPKGEILSYEGPFGVGYCVAELQLDCSEDYKEEKSVILDRYMQDRKSRQQEIRSKEDSYVTLARYTLENFVTTNEMPALPTNLPKEMLEDQAGVFVSLKKHGELRGCIGTIAPTTDSIAEEIMQNALSAGLRDPRFYPVDEEELEELQYSVDVLMKPEPIKDASMLDVRKYGVIVKSGRRSGLLLPNLEGIDTVEEQLEIVLQKAGISSAENFTMERFEVIRHK